MILLIVFEKTTKRSPYLFKNKNLKKNIITIRVNQFIDHSGEDAPG